MNKQFIACLLIGLTVSGFTKPQENKETRVSRVNYFSTQAVHLIAGVITGGMASIFFEEIELTEILILTMLGISTVCGVRDAYKRRQLEQELQECCSTTCG